MLAEMLSHDASRRLMTEQLQHPASRLQPPQENIHLVSKSVVLASSVHMSFTIRCTNCAVSCCAVLCHAHVSHPAAATDVAVDVGGYAAQRLEAGAVCGLHCGSYCESGSRS